MEGYTQSFAPFDFYYLDVVVSVVDKTSGENVSILGIVTGSQVQNFNVFSASDGDLTDIYDPVTGLTPVEGKPHVAFIEVRRSTLARVFTICLLIINWALTSVSAWVTIIVYFRKEKPGDAVLLFPLTLVVTIPALRKLYIGSPPYGILIGTPQAPVPSDPSSRTNVALRYDRVLHADDGSWGLLCISVLGWR